MASYREDEESVVGRCEDCGTIIDCDIRLCARCTRAERYQELVREMRRDGSGEAI